MNGKVSKRLRREAERKTIGQSPKVTRKVYRKDKAEYKRNKSK